MSAPTWLPPLARGLVSAMLVALAATIATVTALPGSAPSGPATVVVTRLITPTSARSSAWTPDAEVTPPATPPQGSRPYDTPTPTPASSDESDCGALTLRRQFSSHANPVVCHVADAQDIRLRASCEDVRAWSKTLLDLSMSDSGPVLVACPLPASAYDPLGQRESCSGLHFAAAGTPFVPRAKSCVYDSASGLLRGPAQTLPADFVIVNRMGNVVELKP